MVNKQLLRRGAAMVEMAIILPLLMVLTFGILEYGWAFIKASQINNAARQGVRTAVRPDADNGEVEAAINVVLTQAEIDEDDCEIDILNLGTAVGEPVTVEVTLTYTSLTGVSLLPLPETILGSATMAKEGPP